MDVPFKFGCIIDGEHFCPRPELERQLKRYISSGQNVFIQGERRRGKSSLIVKAVKDTRGLGLLYVDLLGITNVSELCARIVDGVMELDRSKSFIQKTVSMIATLRPLVVIDQNTGLPSISVDSRAAAKPSSLGAVLQMIATHAKERKICVVFDEFQDILDLEDANTILAQMRGKIQFLSDTSFVFLGSVRNQMSEIFSHPKSPFFKSALEFDIGEIDAEIFADFLVKRFKKGKRKVSKEFVLQLIEQMDGVPGDVQELCDALWSVTGDGADVGAQSLNEAYKYIFAHEGSSYQTYLRQLTIQQRKVLNALAIEGGEHVVSSSFRDAAMIHNASSIQKAINRLIDIGHVYYYHDEYKFVSPFFREWIKQRYSASSLT